MGRFTSLVQQLWYYNSLGQLSSSFTNVPNHGTPLFPVIPGIPANIPFCVSSSASTPMPSVPNPPSQHIDSTSRQVWAGPLSGGHVAVLLCNFGNGTLPVNATFDDVGLNATAANASDLWAGASLGVLTGAVSAHVQSHDCAAIKLVPSQ